MERSLLKLYYNWNTGRVALLEATPGETEIEFMEQWARAILAQCPQWYAQRQLLWDACKAAEEAIKTGGPPL